MEIEMAIYECYLNADCEINAESPLEAKLLYLEFLKSEIDVSDVIANEIQDEE